MFYLNFNLLNFYINFLLLLNKTFKIYKNLYFKIEILFNINVFII